MTMFSFRVDEAEAEETRRWAKRLGVDRSQLLRDALHRYLVRLRAEEDVEAWIRKPLTSDEESLADIADWGPAEDWIEWANEER
ncbi:MAG TPA: ribbon-helix-helix protein, CopG family [Acidimicrobiia bacterium]|nr:ribbon-helix-helix protein, CopG family [Acidimicrobiia bacterium]